MSPEPKRRPRRVPYSQEEVANIIAFKKRKEQLILQAFKRSKAYKYQNIFNVTCFFIYWEILICFFGPANYKQHNSYKVTQEFDRYYDAKGKPIVAGIDFYDENGKIYKFVVNDFIELPNNKSVFYVGKDYLLQKDLKGRIRNDDTTYRLFSASPLMLLIFLTLLTSSMGYYYNLNQNSYSLMSLTVLNGLTLMALVVI